MQKLFKINNILLFDIYLFTLYLVLGVIMKTKNFVIKRLPDLKQDKDKFIFVASDETPDRYGDIVSVDGWNLSNYKLNPIILLNHNSMSLPIGKATDIEVIDNQLVIDVEFDMKDELASKVAQKVQDGFINAVSVGFNATKAVPRVELSTDSKYYGERGMYFENAELLEVSIVTIPANPSATAKQYQNDFMSQMAGMVAKHILGVLEEEDRFLVSFAKHEDPITEEVEDSYKEEEDKEEEEEDKQKSFNMALLAELLNQEI